jgi:hypothetical protein
MEKTRTSDGFIISDAITDLEDRFPLKELLALEYFTKYRSVYYKQRELGVQVNGRNYYNLLKFLAEIHEYRVDDAKAIAKRLRTGGAEWRNCEAIFAEVIVYRYYVRLAYEGIIRSVRLGRAECDVVVERLDGTAAYLELFSIMPDRKQLPDGEISVKEYKTHKQDDPASIRQKLLRKITKQGQMRKARENYAVIELNDVSIAGDFAVLSSLSGGYKITILGGCDSRRPRVPEGGVDHKRRSSEAARNRGAGARDQAHDYVDSGPAMAGWIGEQPERDGEEGEAEGVADGP